ncbi:MAG: hypothetical protein ACQJCO_08445 [cyanobacterium endosymbiont of Rhopalodia sterrenbergii]
MSPLCHFPMALRKYSLKPEIHSQGDDIMDRIIICLAWEYRIE